MNVIIPSERVLKCELCKRKFRLSDMYLKDGLVLCRGCIDE